MTLEELAALPARIEALEAEIRKLKAQKNETGKTVYTVKEAAEYMATSAPAIREWIRSGKLPAFKLSRDGKTLRMYRRDLDALIEILKGESA